MKYVIILMLSLVSFSSYASCTYTLESNASSKFQKYARKYLSMKGFTEILYPSNAEFIVRLDGSNDKWEAISSVVIMTPERERLITVSGRHSPLIINSSTKVAVRRAIKQLPDCQ
jgi:hypothetical protein